MATVKFYDNDALMSGEYTAYQVDSVAHWILENINPGQAFSVYCGDVTQSNSIPITPEDLAALGEGEYTIMLTPAAAAVPYIVALVVAVAVVALTPKPDLPQNISRSQESPNNRLSSRSNVARPLQRIPDINGEVLSIPDVVMPSYTIYQEDIQIIRGYYCVGINDVLISDVEDSDTPIDLISKSGAGIYGPGKNPNNSAPDTVIGEPQSWNIETPYRLNDVNGRLLDSTSSITIDVGWVQFPDTATMTLLKRDLTSWDEFTLGQSVQIDVTINDIVKTKVKGVFVIQEFLTTPNGHPAFKIIFANSSSKYQWTATGGVSDVIQEYSDWVYFTKDNADRAQVNVVAPNGLYEDTGDDALGYRSVSFTLQVQLLDDNNNDIGYPADSVGSMSGNSSKIYALTFGMLFSYPSKFKARMKRNTARYVGDGVASDNINWDDCYAFVGLPNGHDFGNVTTIQTQTSATPSATSIRERQLNCIAQEQLEPYINSTTKGALAPNRSAVQSFIRSALDPRIGNRSVSEIDIDGLLATEQEIITYFSADHSTHFDYTMDSTETSFQEYAQMVFNAINSIGYRDGSIIKAIFEKPIVAPSMLFTHRSKIPGTERYTRNFNPSTIHDGVEFNWVSPVTQRTETIYLADNPPAINPKIFNIPGIRNEKQAIIRANREYNKIKLAKMQLDLSVTAEGRYVLPNSTISVVKGSRVYTEDGEVLAQDGLTLTLSQDVDFSGAGPFSIVLKDDDGTTESIIVSAGAMTNEVILAGAPSTVIRTGIDSRRTEFSFGSDSRLNAQLWMAQEIDISQKIQVGLKCINYEEGYYAGDDVNLGAYSSGYSNGYDVS